MLIESTQRCRRNAAEIGRVRWFFEVLNIEQGRCKNTRVIEKGSGKPRRANLLETIMRYFSANETLTLC